MKTLALAFLLPAALNLAAAEPQIKRVPTPYTHPASGERMYLAYCASCHGNQGAGNGPVAVHLKVAIPNLTHLSKQNKGEFPAARVAQVIRGEVDARTHGLKDMPVWGPVFRSFDGGQTAVVHKRVANLTKYIETLQAK
jgi:mono/diheme cytochrome c family protein